jgi:hypothetical protein
MGFAFTLPVLVFVLAATLTAALVFGALPAWHMARTDPGSRLKDNSRGTFGSARELRSGRWLVGVQLALSLPLLVGAGLLVRTVYNLQRPDLGFDAERLLLARVDLGAIVQDTARRDRVLRELLAHSTDSGRGGGELLPARSVQRRVVHGRDRGVGRRAGSRAWSRLSAGSRGRLLLHDTANPDSAGT